MQYNFNIEKNYAGLEQVKTAYTERKNKYEKANVKDVNDKEIIKEIINDVIFKETQNTSNINSGTVVPATSIFDNDNSSNTKANKVLEELVNIAFNDGIGKAIQMSLKTSNAYLIDQLHDVLINEFYEMLIKQGKIENN